ncbi:hypothetical protein LCGC14_1979510 [marine sediment metagenome]|uniref:Uncharacterized protein n=2 Tax=root TaxID=1 RepID=A0A9C9THC0_9HYPH|nr:hypothetical protein [Aurantimonas coralicida]
MTERRQGMDELNQRLTRLETIATSELGEPGEGGGQLRRDIADVRTVVDRIDETLGGSTGAGLGEQVRRLERNQAFIITGLFMALSAAVHVAWGWARARLTGGQL